MATNQKKKSVCALQHPKETQLNASPQPKHRQKCSDFSLQQLSNPCFGIFHVECIAHMTQSRLLPLLNLLSLAFMLIFWTPFPPSSFSHFPFPILQNTLPLCVFPFYNHKSLFIVPGHIVECFLHLCPHFYLVSLAQKP